MRQPVVTLTTDFGLADHFVGAMKGVILTIEPRAHIVDISHEIAPYSIPGAAFALAQAYRCFPPGTVHLAVVDPGVGASRRPILAEAARHLFVAPDNGVLSMVYAQERHKVRAITRQEYFRRPVSRTFHGRDVFAPVAAHLAHGVTPARFGKLVLDYVRGDFAEPASSGELRWTGRVLKIDRFGNLITNFAAAEFTDLETRAFEVRAGPRRITACLHNYAQGKPGQLFAIAGSSGFLEIATNQGSAAKLTGCAAGAEVDLVLR